MQVIRIYYISLSGNTTNFLERLDHYLQRELQEKLDYVNVKDFVTQTSHINCSLLENLEKSVSRTYLVVNDSTLCSSQFRFQHNW